MLSLKPHEGHTILGLPFVFGAGNSVVDRFFVTESLFTASKMQHGLKKRRLMPTATGFVTLRGRQTLDFP